MESGLVGIPSPAAGRLLAGRGIGAGVEEDVDDTAGAVERQ